MFDSSKYTSRGRFKRTKFTPSSVDETLFGERRTTLEPDPVPEFEPPWVDNGKTKLKPQPKPLLFYCPTSPSRPSSQASVRTPEKRYKPVKFSPTYVDDTLFGKNDEERQRHDLKMERFVTSMPVKEISFDGHDCKDSARTDSARSTSRSVRTTRPHSSQRRELLEKTLPPWR